MMSDMDALLKLSTRTESILGEEDFLCKYLYKAVDDRYDRTLNPNGFVNMGTSVNNMTSDLILKKMNSPGMWELTQETQQYVTAYGTMSLRSACANFISKFMKTTAPVDPENIFCLSGATPCLDVLGHCLADPNDVILSSIPMYPRIPVNFSYRSLVGTWKIDLSTEVDADGNFPFHITLHNVEKAYEAALAEGKKVKAIIIVNPHNPLGNVLTQDTLLEILNFCKTKQIHVIMDEVYALSVFDNKHQFCSALSLPELPDPQHTHVVYSLSKDMTLSGLRVGIIHTQHPQLQHCLKQLAPSHSIAGIVMDAVSKLLVDTDWCEQYLTTNRAKLKSAYEFCKYELEEMGVRVLPSAAGFFIFADFKKYCQPLNFDTERALFKMMFETGRVYIVPGEKTLNSEPGWFRIVFSNDKVTNEEGLRRLKKVIHDLKENPKILEAYY